MFRIAPHATVHCPGRGSLRFGTARRALVLAAVPVLLVAGCSSDSDDGGADSSDAPESSASSAPSPEAVKFTELPDPCKTVKEETVESAVPNAETKSGKNLGTQDADSSAVCLWSGLDDFDYRALSVTLRRFDSENGLGSGDERATEHAEEQLAAAAEDKEHKDAEDGSLEGVGDSARTVTYTTTKKDGDDKEEYREQRTVARTANVVITVDYSGAGLEDAKTPSAEALAEESEKVAGGVVAAIK